MRQPTMHELRSLEDILDWIRPIINLEYLYVEADNAIMIGDNYVIRGGTQKMGDVSLDTFNLIYGETHPGDTSFDLSRWEEEDIGTARSVYSLLPIFIASLFQRLAEEKVYSKIRLAKHHKGG